MAHALGRHVWVTKQPGAVHQDELLGQVRDRARALHAADHPEVRLMAVQVGGEHDARLVEARGRPEDVARQREGVLDIVEERVQFTIVKPGESLLKEAAE